MKIKTTGAALVITTDIKAEDFCRVTRFKKDVNILKDAEKKNAIYAVDFDPCRTGSFGPNATTFDAVTPDGHMTISVLDEALNHIETEEDKKNYIADTYGRSLNFITQIEAQIADQVPALAAFETSVKENIQVL